LAAALAGFACLAQANAGIVKYTIENGGLEDFGITMDGASENTLAGGIEVVQNPSGNNTELPESYVTVCTDINASLYIGHTYKYDTLPSAFSGLSGISPTWGAVNTAAYLSGNSVDLANAAQAIQNAAFIFNTFGNLTANSTGMSGTQQQLSAVQLAVWAVLYDTTANGQVNLGNGARFGVAGGDAAAISLMDSYIADLNNQANAGNFGITGYALVPNMAPNPQGNPDGEPPQELLINGNDFDPPPVPEPTTIIAGILLLLPFGASALRIIRRNKAA
jgi:hypothetical protein